MRLLYLFLLCLYSHSAWSQEQPFSYDDYFYYRNHQYLQTPSMLISGASIKAQGGDTVRAVEMLTAAAKLGMYDTSFISSRKGVSFVTRMPQWQTIRNSIAANRQQYANPQQMKISTEDIDRFWNIYDQLNGTNAEAIVMSQYIVPGSIGLQTFFEVRMGLRATALIQSVRKHRTYYESIRLVSQQLYRFKPQLISAAVKFKELYEDAIFPPTYFVMSNFQAFGTPDGGAGQLIGAEFLCNKSSVDTSSLGSWEKTVIADTSKLPGILIHELVHIQQNTAMPKTLLEKSINEGACDFITELILGYNINSTLHEYGNRHEKALWEKFKVQMHGEDLKEWLYNGFNAERNTPGDLGYYMGYKICEAYFAKRNNQKEAVREILNINDFRQFLEASGYAQKLN